MATDTTNGNGITLDAAQATIKTFTISIRSLQIGPRQLTFDIFRQLQKKHLIDQEIPTLREGAEVWGWVNAQVDGGHRPRKFVVRFDDQLYQCLVHMVRSDEFHQKNGYRPSGYDKLRNDFRCAAHKWYLATILDRAPNLNFDTPEYKLLTPVFSRMGSLYIGRHDFGSWDDAISKEIGEVFSRSRYRVGSPGNERCKSDYENARNDFERTVSKCVRDWVPGSEYWLKEMDEINDRAETYAREWDAILDKLQSVKQLFIIP